MPYRVRTWRACCDTVKSWRKGRGDEANRGSRPLTMLLSYGCVVSTFAENINYYSQFYQFWVWQMTLIFVFSLFVLVWEYFSVMHKRNYYLEHKSYKLEYKNNNENHKHHICFISIGYAKCYKIPQRKVIQVFTTIFGSHSPLNHFLEMLINLAINLK